jgi:hypothetical protein
VGTIERERSRHRHTCRTTHAPPRQEIPPWATPNRTIGTECTGLLKHWLSDELMNSRASRLAMCCGIGMFEVVPDLHSHSCGPHISPALRCDNVFEHVTALRVFALCHYMTMCPSPRCHGEANGIHHCRRRLEIELGVHSRHRV